MFVFVVEFLYHSVYSIVQDSFHNFSIHFVLFFDIHVSDRLTSVFTL